MLLTEDVTAYDNVWILGEDFVASTVCLNFKLMPDNEFFMKTEFDYSVFYGSRYENNKQNMEEIIQKGRSNYPAKPKKESAPIIYWVVLPKHRNFMNNDIRVRFNLCLESIIKQKRNMHMMKLKEVWNEEEDLLVHANSGQITSYGAKKYWRAIDAAFKFNYMRFFTNNRKKTSVPHGRSHGPFTRSMLRIGLLENPSPKNMLAHPTWKNFLEENVTIKLLGRNHVKETDSSYPGHRIYIIISF